MRPGVEPPPTGPAVRPLVALATVAGAALAALVPAAAIAREGLAVEGLDRTRLLAPAGALIEDYENVGYRLRRIGDEIRIEVDVSSLASASRFVPPRTSPSSEDPSGAAPPTRIDRLARGLTANRGTTYEAISGVLGWISRSIAYDLDRDAPQGAESVLARRSTYCTGVARLTVALLRSAGIAAREVAGYVVDAEGKTRGFHRWIEAYLPDRGWVFSDPLRSHHYVPATYVRLAGERIAPELGTEGLLLERGASLQAVDLYLGAAPGITARRNSEASARCGAQRTGGGATTPGGGAPFRGYSSPGPSTAGRPGDPDRPVLAPRPTADRRRRRFRRPRARPLTVADRSARSRRRQPDGESRRTGAQGDFSAGVGSRWHANARRRRMAGIPKGGQRVNRIMAALLFMAAVVSAGCGYTLAGRATNIPEDVRRIHIETLVNGTSRPQVEQILTQAISEEMVTRRRFNLVNSSAEADGILSGKVLSFSVRPLTFDTNGLADNFEIVVTADMTFARPPAPTGDEGEVLWNNSRYVFRQDYTLEEENVPYFDRETLAIEETSERFAKTMVTDLLEGF